MMRWIPSWATTLGCWLIYLQVANLLVANGSSKEILKIDGTIEKFKARLVIQGFKQKSGIDYFDTYALVARISTIRLLIAMASIHNLIIHQMDVKTAFLNEKLEEEVYMNQPQGFIMHGNKNSKFDEADKRVIICLYVDDMLIFGTDQVQIDLTKDLLSSRFSMKDMREADVILGIRNKHESNGITISLSHYIEKHWQAIQRVLKYLKKTMDYRLTYTGYPSVLEGYTDASWISNTEDNSSTSGWVFFLGGGAIS
ncbi:zinc finger, CCHC-type containing protein [Tanacetum coccineum]|uniref:Zinc finger, CCHC-type containing protein n=1 Tax=Tanacetum coccineum TaxID=301880 RepID=A0ABQ5C7D6_9ASTR